MRISTAQLYTQGIQAFGTQQTKLALLQQQISTGVRITKPSDDPAGAARSMEVQQIIELNQQFQVNINMADQRLALQDTTLSAVENVIQRVRELTIRAGNATLDDVSREAIAVEIDQRLEELVSLANTTDENGDFLFAGFQNNSEPFTLTQTGSLTHMVANGDQGIRSLQISQTRQIDVDTNGLDLFMRVESSAALNETTPATNTGSGAMAPAHVFDNSVYVAGEYRIEFTGANTYNVVDVSGSVVPAGTNLVTGATYTDSENIDFNGIRTSITGAPAAGDTFTITQGQYQDVFTTVGSLSETLNATATDAQYSANLAQTLNDIDAAFEKLLNARTSIGGRLNSLDSQYEDNDAYIISSKETLSTIRDTDLAEAISQLTLEQTTLDAAQAVFARVTSSSLFNFLR